MQESIDFLNACYMIFKHEFKVFESLQELIAEINKNG